MRRPFLTNLKFKSPDQYPRGILFRKHQETEAPEAHSAELERLRDVAFEKLREYKSNDNHDVIPGLILRYALERHASEISARDLRMAQRYIEVMESSVGEDTLTHVQNRRQYDRVMAGRFARIERQRAAHEQPEQFSLAVIDIDHFKAINTAGGHPAGDIVLQELTKLVQASMLRATDTLFRYGGEEFVLLMPQTSITAAEQIMERVRMAIEAQLLPAVLARMQPGPERDRMEQLGSITASIGVSALRDEHRAPDQTFTESDTALYAAKTGSLRADGIGRNRVEVYQPGMQVPGAKAADINAVPVSAHDLAALHASETVTITEESPTEILQRYRSSVLPSSEMANLYLDDGRFYPADPVKGLHLIFSREKVRQSFLSNRVDPNGIHTVDVALNHLQEAQLSDPLTRLPNRRAYDQHIRTELAESTRDLRKRAVIIFDIDHFKRINDSFGHTVGDLVLYHFGRALAELTHADEFSCRLGGEEFACVVTTNSVTELQAIAERFRSGIEATVMDKVREYFQRRMIPITFDRSAFTVSAGAVMSELKEVPATQPAPGASTPRMRMQATSPKTLYQRADKALYIAKGQSDLPLESWQTNAPEGAGRNRWVMYDPRMEAISTGK